MDYEWISDLEIHLTNTTPQEVSLIDYLNYFKSNNSFFNIEKIDK